MIGDFINIPSQFREFASQQQFFPTVAAAVSSSYQHIRLYRQIMRKRDEEPSEKGIQMLYF